MWAPPSPPITGSLVEFLHHQEAPEHLSWGGAAGGSRAIQKRAESVPVRPSRRVGPGGFGTTLRRARIKWHGDPRNEPAHPPEADDPPEAGRLIPDAHEEHVVVLSWRIGNFPKHVELNAP